MNYIYAPGCALMIYKPHLADKIKDILTKEYGPIDEVLNCCLFAPQLDKGACIITPCVACHHQYAKNYQTIFFLDMLAKSQSFPFPDYQGIEMTIHDTCTARQDDFYLDTVRTLLKRMNINIVESQYSRKKGICCGQVFYNKLPLDQVEERMKVRANQMIKEDVVVYCPSCIQSLAVGGKRPHFILDLLFNEETVYKDANIENWRNSLKDFQDTH